MRKDASGKSKPAALATMRLMEIALDIASNYPAENILKSVPAASTPFAHFSPAAFHMRNAGAFVALFCLMPAN
jgi:hypothetical protein